MIHATQYTIDQQKNLMRQNIRQQRKVMQRNNPQAGMQLAERLCSWSAIGPHHTISAYWPINSEIDTQPYIITMCELGGLLALPITNFSTHHLTFHSWHTDLLLKVSDQGIMQPESTCPQVNPDVVLVPLLAFDQHGSRLGYGRGHYDRALQHLRQIKSIMAVGIGYDEQLVAHVPCNEQDQKLDYIMTPSHLYHCTGHKHV